MSSSSSSDQDTSEGSNSEAQLSLEETPDSSPAQRVPSLHALSRNSPVDVSMHKDDHRPWLEVIEQPQTHFRFRYKSERESGSHGCLMGYTTSTTLRKYPTVQLRNYAGRARVECRLFTEDKVCEHPHQLLENDQANFCGSVVPEQGSYKVCFRGMGIIHTAKKDLFNALVKKRLEKTPNATKKEIKKECQEQANSVNLNVVLLKFSAYDFDTNKEICSEYSWPIKNLKSPATNPMNICKYSKTCGSANGGEEVFLLVDKVTKKNIKVRFFQLDENNERCWEAWAHFNQSDVHHQYAIVIRTPKYDRFTLSSKVQVFMELVRTTDGATSAPREFFYIINKNHKKRKINPPPLDQQLSTAVAGCSWSPLTAAVPPLTPRVILRPQYCDQSTRQNLQFKEDISVLTVEGPQQNNVSLRQTSRELEYSGTSTQVTQTSREPVPQQFSAEVFRPPDLLDAYQNGAHESYNPGTQLHEQGPTTKMLISETTPDEELFILPTTGGHAGLTQGPSISEDSNMIIVGSTISKDITNQYAVLPILPESPMPGAPDDGSDTTMVSASDPMMGQGNPNIIDMPAIMHASNVGGNIAEFEQFQANFGLNIEEYDCPFDITQFENDMPDSGRPKRENFVASQVSEPQNVKTELFGNQRQPFDVSNLERERRPAFKPEDVIRVKKLIKEIIIGIRRNENRLIMTEKLEQLCEIRTSNGDTFLHMALSHNQSSFETIVKLIHSMKMPHLLNLTNDLQQTILHLAVIHDQPELVAFLVAKGCDPMIEDNDGNNVLHNAVIYENSLESLLDAIKINDVECDFEEFNYEKQTALHLAAIYDSDSSARLLLKHGASYNARDSEGRTPLHLAIYDDHLAVTRALLDSTRPLDVDAVDRTGRTALQMACEGEIRKNSLKIIKLLLEKGADAYMRVGKSKSAMELAKRTPNLWQFLNEQIINLSKHSVDGNLEDEFFSADEAESEDHITSGLQKMKLK